MDNIFDRTALLLGKDGLERLRDSRIIVLGVGGVGSWAAECLIRTGVGHLTIVDPDMVSATNINRQLMATTATVGKPKAEVLKDRLLEINPEAEIKVRTESFTPESAHTFNLQSYDYVIDAIDSLKDKAELILLATSVGVPLLSSMGAALKLDPTRIHVAEFWDVKGCPLARALRQRFKRNKTYPKTKFKCVYSDELLQNVFTSSETCDYKAQINGSLCHITAIFGMTLAGIAVKGLINLK
jgi:tRNA A37 threonylcarbamoyladenosine dehydratase